MLEEAVMIQLTWELMRLKAYYLKLLLNTHHMVLRPKEKFPQAIEVEWVRSWQAQKVLTIMDFECFRRRVGKRGT